MISNEKIWIGVDPGGNRNFGLAILYPNGSAWTSCVDHADAAIETLQSKLDSAPTGVGVDAPLWWSSGRSSDRQADQWIRARYGLSGGNVQAANSLRGAALVQGAMFVHRLRERFPDIRVTESHPKAVWVALQLLNWENFCTRFEIKSQITGHQHHERDAILSAIAAREGFENRWPNDLSRNRHPSELNPHEYWLAPVYYFWPEA